MSTGYQIIDWIDLFTRKVYRDIIIDSLRFCQQHKGLEIYSFVIMFICWFRKKHATQLQPGKHVLCQKGNFGL